MIRYPIIRPDVLIKLNNHRFHEYKMIYSSFTKTLFKMALYVLFTMPFGLLSAQETETLAKQQGRQNAKDSITEQEREHLKTKIQHINRLLRKNEISLRVADSLKIEAAEAHARNIQEKMIKHSRDTVPGADINRFYIGKRFNNDSVYYESTPYKYSQKWDFRQDTVKWRYEKYHYKHPFTNKRRQRMYRTSSDLVVGIGLNNTYSESIPIEESDYHYLGSRFFELGWSWTSMVSRNSDFFRFRYGASLQFNGLKPTDNRYFVMENRKVQLIPYYQALTKSKLNITHLVFPVHVELGNRHTYRTRMWDDNENYSRYYVNRYSDPIIVGFGAYAGFNLKAVQKLKYELDGKIKKVKLDDDLNVTRLLYGLSAYIAFSEVVLYAKYDLTPLFTGQLFPQQNISLGVRFDIR